MKCLLQPYFEAGSYDMLRKNCNNFSLFSTERGQPGRVFLDDLGVLVDLKRFHRFLREKIEGVDCLPKILLVSLECDPSD